MDTHHQTTGRLHVSNVKVLTEKASTSPTDHYPGSDVICFFNYMMQKFEEK
jgi:hypothetical protein